MKIQRSIALGLTLALIALAALACGKTGNSTPTEAWQTYYNAVKNTDVKAMKSISPKKYREQVEDAAKVENITVDEGLTRELKRIAPRFPATMPETRNEKIEGDKATLEIKNGENWSKVHLVKEDDGWKADFR